MVTHFLYWERITHWVWRSLIWLSWLSKQLYLTLALGLHMCTNNKPDFFFSLGSGNPNPGPFACVASSLLTEPYPQLPIIIFKKFIEYSRQTLSVSVISNESIWQVCASVILWVAERVLDTTAFGAQTAFHLHIHLGEISLLITVSWGRQWGSIRNGRMQFPPSNSEDKPQAASSVIRLRFAHPWQIGLKNTPQFPNL